MVGPYASMMVAWCLLAKGSRSVISLSLIPFCQMQETVSPRGGGGASTSPYRKYYPPSAVFSIQPPYLRPVYICVSLSLA